MKKNGKTSAGRTRWRRKDPGRGSPLSRGYDRRAADPETSPRRLSSRQSRAEHAIPARTPRRMNELSWGLWPPVPLVDEVYGVAHLDGVRLHRDAVVLIAIACGHVIGRHVAKSETAAAWAHPIAGIAPPLAVAVDGGGGIPKALRERRPDTKAQRCLFHVCMNVTQPTGIKPRSGAGKQLRKVAVALSRVTDTDAAAAWPASYSQWGQTYDAFLDEKSTYADGTIADRRQRLVRARRMIRKRIPREPPVHVPGTDQGSHHADPSDEQPHRVWNGRIRGMLRHHRGSSLLRRIKATCRRCYQHARQPGPVSWLMTNAISDQQIEEPYRKAWEHPQGAHETYGIPNRYGTGIDRNEFHTPVRYPNTTD
mgnify:CR=1 FL=1